MQVELRVMGSAMIEDTEHNFTLLLDAYMEERAKVLDSSFTIGAMTPFQINSNLWLPDTTVATIMNCLRQEDDTDDHGPLYQKLQKVEL